MGTSTNHTCLAFDYGTKSIGAAVGNSIINSAREIPPLKAIDGIPRWEHIEALLKEWQITMVIVGLPLNMDGSESDMSRRAKKFGNRIHGRFGVPVNFVDERLTSNEAKEEASRDGHKGDYHKNPVDSIAARLILQDWWNQSTS